jgi:hypothetical protein
MTTYAARNYDVVSRRDYFCLYDRPRSVTFGNRYPTREAAQKALRGIIARQEAELEIPCVLCGHAAGLHAGYRCPG